MDTMMNLDEETFYDAIEHFDYDNIDVISTLKECSLFTQQVHEEPWVLHRIALSGDAHALKKALKTSKKENLAQLDPQGHSALHVAVFSRNAECLDILLEAGIPPGIKSARGWKPLHIAIELQEQDLALRLLKAEFLNSKLEDKVKKKGMLQELWNLPDFTAKLHWELGSSVPGLGLLIRRLAPHDTYTIWKKGSCIRIDGSLMGMKESGTSGLPDWKKGRFSLLYNGEGGGANGRPLAAFVNRMKEKWVDLQATRKKMKPVEMKLIEVELQKLMSQPVVSTKKVKAAKFRFKPATGWLSREVAEKVECWDTKVYEAVGSLWLVEKHKAPFLLPNGVSWQEYLAFGIGEDDVREKEVDLVGAAVSSNSSKSDKKSKEKGAQGHGRSREGPISSTCDDKSTVSSHRKEGKTGYSASSGLLHHSNQHEGLAKLHTSSMTQTHEGAVISGNTPVASAVTQSRRVSGRSNSNSNDGNSNGGSGGVSARFWMCCNFPLNLKQLLPLLDVLGTANKYLAKVSNFMSKYGNMDMFPVKVKIPIAFTVYACFCFKSFELLGGASSGSHTNHHHHQQQQRNLLATSEFQALQQLPEGFFEVPISYTLFEAKAVEKLEAHISEMNLEQRQKHKEEEQGGGFHFHDEGDDSEDVQYE
ncbi:hypothetical protein CEUSTIGMA_g12603.t1 [Chlamydomonas eustigma]|uniref:Ankyrin repeat domain-containing protein n=1 Tax=Chlamydomonas eustigma TaxID=1157962 RepID=A0A250XQ48_9CHLO|nr:hypothetical protein CEUSTIGMA_g12603.t1 [Chlamydomonas eustigma]|eukprot:GAX85185.1 hypothetical protein CEUSTIGMA_g12603.t1 [Chlamydomonas eustigma]